MAPGYIYPKSLLVIGIVLPILASVAVALRFTAKKLHAVRLEEDDWLILASLILTVGLGIALIVGSALHALAQPTPSGHGPEDFMTVLTDPMVITEKMAFTFNITQPIALGLAKLSVLFFYRRIFIGKWFDILSWSMIALVIIWMISFFFAILFPCHTAFWAYWSTLKALLANCNDSIKTYEAFPISDVITDGLILLLPLYWILGLQMSLLQKVAVCGVLLTGFLAIAAGIARLVVWMQQTHNFASKADGIGHLSTEMYWSMIEMGLSVIAACLPTLRPVIREIWASKVRDSLRNLFSSGLKDLPERPCGNADSHRHLCDGLTESSGTDTARFTFRERVETQTISLGVLEAQREHPPKTILVHENISTHFIDSAHDY